MEISDQRRAAKSFYETWKDADYEKGQTQTFWLSLLRDVFGISKPEKLYFLKIR